MEFQHKKSFWLSMFSLLVVSATLVSIATDILINRNQINDKRHLVKVLFIWAGISGGAIAVVPAIFAIVEKCKKRVKCESDTKTRNVQGDDMAQKGNLID